MIQYFKRMSSFIDPYSIYHLFSKSTSIHQILEHYNHQKSVFLLKDHGKSLLSNIVRLKNEKDAEYALKDGRFKDFLTNIKKEPSFYVFVEILNQLSYIYNYKKLPLPDDIKEEFYQRITQNNDFSPT